MKHVFFARHSAAHAARSAFMAVAACAALCASAPAAAACYTVYAANGRVIHQSDVPPVPMSPQLHQTVPARFGRGATMRFTLANETCIPIGVSNASASAATADRAERAGPHAGKPRAARHGRSRARAARRAVR